MTTKVCPFGSPHIRYTPLSLLHKKRQQQTFTWSMKETTLKLHSQSIKLMFRIPERGAGVLEHTGYAPPYSEFSKIKN